MPQGLTESGRGADNVKPSWQEIRLAIVGGDRRELEVANVLSGWGAQVRAVGLPWPDEVSWLANQPEDTMAWANVVLTPVGGTDPFGRVAYSIVNGAQEPLLLSGELFAALHPGTLWLIGLAQPFLREAAARYGFRLVEFRERDDFAIANSVPTAEGAIQMAIEHTDITLHEARVLVLGYGRTAHPLAQRLRALGSCVTVVARSTVDRVRAQAEGMRALPFSDFPAAAVPCDVVFNTVPAPVLSESTLATLRPLLVIDLASAPGGTDFKAARRLGIEALLAPGLPGIVAPKTAGRIVAATVAAILEEERSLV